MSRAVLSIGSNLDDRESMLRKAAEAFRPWLQAASPIYETPPWGPVAQGPYLNAVLLVSDPTAAPRDWLRRAQAAEQDAGRVRDLRSWPRTLDVDVIAVDDVVSTDPELTLPHPRAAERAFVLIPWQSVDPDARLSGRLLSGWLADLPPEELAAVRRIDDLVLS